MTDSSDILSLPHQFPTLHEQMKIIALAHQGNQTARNEIITSCLHYVKSVAKTLSIAYQVEFDELVGIGNLTLVEKLDIALQKENAFPYLKSCVKRHLRLACYKRWYEREQDKDIAIPIHEEKGDYTFLYEAINTLPYHEREVVSLHYGLLGSPKESLFQLSLTLSSNPRGTILYMRLRRATNKLRYLLVSSSGQDGMGYAYLT